MTKLSTLDKRLKKEQQQLRDMMAELEKARQAGDAAQRDVKQAMAGARFGEVWARAAAAIGRQNDITASKLAADELERRIAEQKEVVAAALDEWRAARFREGQAQIFAECNRIASELAAFEAEFQKLDKLRNQLHDETYRWAIVPLGYSVVRGMNGSYERFKARQRRKGVEI